MTTHLPIRLLCACAVAAAATGFAVSAWAEDGDNGGVVVNASQRAFISRLQPVVGTGAALFDPEVSIVTSGVLNDVQATVSPDRKYVTMTMRATNSQLLALREFAFQTGGQTTGLPAGVQGGLVGGAGGGGNANCNGGVNAGVVAGGNDNASAARGAGMRTVANGSRATSHNSNRTRPQTRPAAQPPTTNAEPSILDRPGMTRIATLDE